MGCNSRYAVFPFGVKKTNLIQQNNQYIIQNEEFDIKNANFQGRRQNLHKGCKIGA
jgi:hypothetical protein